MSKTAYRNVPAVVVNMNMKVKPMFLNAHRSHCQDRRAASWHETLVQRAAKQLAHAPFFVIDHFAPQRRAPAPPSAPAPPAPEGHPAPAPSPQPR